MPSGCAAYGCNNYCDQNTKEKGISFFRFPLTDKPRLKEWLIKMKRKNFKPYANARLCSEHFLEEDFEYQPYSNRRCLKKTAVPTKFVFTAVKKQARPKTTYKFGSGIVPRDELRSSEAGCSSKEEKATQTDEGVISCLLEENDKLMKQITKLQSDLKVLNQTLNPETLNDHFMCIFIGFTRNQFNAIFLFLEDIDKQNLFIFLVKLRTGMTESMIGFFFNMSQSCISRIFTSVTASAYKKIRTVGIWPGKSKIFEDMPYIFKVNFPQCRVIVDCTEFPIQKPSSPKEQQLTFSNYKNTNTVKCMIGISPSGGISFISDVWGGSVSDKELFLSCGILDILEPGDTILADRGFTVKKEVEAKGCTLKTPSFLKDKIQFNIIERRENKKISKHRVHVERAILRIKQFKFFHGHISYNSLHSVSQLIYIAAFFTNFGNSLIKC